MHRAENLALAVAEIRVHRDEFPEEMAATKVLIPAELILLVEALHTLPVTWPTTIDVTRRFGNLWLEKRHSAVPSVPSVVVRQERNYLVNPRLILNTTLAEAAH